eukprot:gb/GFBE01006996.1/.p1 GENE.gb/GFBE01006996.1/~~gb/GFBE01006996.1/.p1  ORF type:complete len:567 (+),score=82.49 gb/GFBE01006996.1/:1-1701(+)
MVSHPKVLGERASAEAAAAAAKPRAGVLDGSELVDTPEDGVRLHCSAGSARSNLEQVAKKLRQHTEANADLIRGALLSTVLRRGCALLWEGPSNPASDQQDLHHLSRPCAKLSSFLSHSWHAPARAKAMALSTYYNGTVASWFGILFVLLAASLQYVGFLPAWVRVPNICGNTYAPGGPEYVEHGLWCILAYMVGYWMAFLNLWRCLDKVRGAQAPRMFLDKVCIHQTDPVLKRQGIDSIGSVLMSSQEMHLAWDSTYFERLWCVFEVAVFLSLNETGTLTFVPSSLYMQEFVMVIVVQAMQVLTGALHALNLLQPVVKFAADLGIPDFLIQPLLVHGSMVVGLIPVVYSIRKFGRDHEAILQQLQDFTFANAKCARPEDRVFVQHIIEELYGSTEGFEHVVRTKVRQVILDTLGPTILIPYSMLVRMLLPTMTLFGFDIPLAFSAMPLSYRLHWVVGALIITLVLLPAFIMLTYKLSMLRLHTSSRKQELHTVVLLAMNVVAPLMFLLLSVWPFVLRESVYPKIAVVLVSAALGLTWWRHVWLARIRRGCTWRRKQTFPLDAMNY